MNIRTVENQENKRKAVVILNLDESFEVEYYENSKLVHSYEVVGSTYDKVHQMAELFVHNNASPELLEG